MNPEQLIAAAADMWAANWSAEIAERAMLKLDEAGYVIVRAPSVAFKGPNDSDAAMMVTAAEKAESARYPVGGSNVGRAVGQVLRDVAEQMRRAAARVT